MYTYSAFVLIVISLLSPTVLAANNSQVCDLYPLAIPHSLVATKLNGSSLRKIPLADIGALSWSGDTSESVFVNSLTSPSNYNHYINPTDASDEVLNVSDWVTSLTSIPTSKRVKSSFKAIKGLDITVPAWSQKNGQNEYQVAEFISINITGFKLKGKKSLSFIYNGVATCSESNLAPIANNASRSTVQDTALPVTLTGSDADGDPLSFNIVSEPVYGILSGNGANQTYTPNNGFSGQDTFTFTVNDGTEDSNVATITIDVTAASNIAPIANDASISTVQDTALPVTLTGSDADCSGTVILAT